MSVQEYGECAINKMKIEVGIKKEEKEETTINNDFINKHLDEILEKVLDDIN